MEINLDYKTFCNLYYKAAEEVADITVAEHVKKNGQLNPYIDVELVKDLGVSYGLEKVYNNYDVDHESKAKIETFLSKVVRNCVLTELGKEATAVAAKKRSSKAIDFMKEDGMFASDDRFSGFRDYIESGDRYEKKEELIAQMMHCFKKLNGVDQVILKCWMLYPKRDYIDMALDELEWEDNKRTRNVVSVRWGRALESLREKMEGARSAYVDIYFQIISIDNEPEITPVPKKHSEVDYNFIRRRQRAAKKSITRRIDYQSLANALSLSLPD